MAGGWVLALRIYGRSSAHTTLLYDIKYRIITTCIVIVIVQAVGDFGLEEF